MVDEEQLAEIYVKACSACIFLKSHVVPVLLFRSVWNLFLCMVLVSILLSLSFLFFKEASKVEGGLVAMDI